MNNDSLKIRLVFSLISFLVSTIDINATSNYTITVSGTFSGTSIPKNGYAVLNKLDYDNKNVGVIDTFLLSSLGTFSKIITIPGADVLTLDFNGKTQLILAFIPDENISIFMDNGDLSIVGSPGSLLAQEYEKLRKESFSSLLSPINEKISNADDKGDKIQLHLLSAEYVLQYTQHKRELTTFVRQNMMQSPSAYISSLRWNADEDLLFMDSLLVSIRKLFPEQPIVGKLESKIKRFKKTAIGNMAPSIALNDPQFQEVKLSDYRGKYVLVDVWASWCRPCRQENPFLVKNYDKYNSKGFEILGVSLDEDKSRWLSAIFKDQLKWRQVSDLEGWKSVVAYDYNVTAIPSNFLIDREGKIIAKNLRGVSLDEKLAELFK